MLGGNKLGGGGQDKTFQVNPTNPHATEPIMHSVQNIITIVQ